MKMLSIASLAFVLSGVAGAADVVTPTPNNNNTPQSGAQAQQEGAPVGTQVQTMGKIVSTHSLQLVNSQDAHILAKLETEGGDTDIVDLGSTAELKENGFEPKEGQKIWVDGRVGKINDKFLIVAERLSESKLMFIDRTAPLREETVKHADERGQAKDVNATREVTNQNGQNAQPRDPSAPKTETVDAGQQVRTIQGNVIHTRKVRIEGEADEHVLAKVKTENGIAVIDLGTCPRMPNSVNLTEGQPLAVTGVVGQLNGKPIILADSVGNMTAIQRNESLPTSTTAPANK